MNEPLPELTEGVLDSTTLAALFDDLEAHTLVLDVLVKGGATVMADARPVGLRDAQRLLESRSIGGVQVRYRWDGNEWRDTLLATGAGVKLVRMAMPG